MSGAGSIFRKILKYCLLYILNHYRMFPDIDVLYDERK